ncbi:hypothetical protein QOT17_013355 [Balamuthia mandrillaris]
MFGGGSRAVFLGTSPMGARLQRSSSGLFVRGCLSARGLAGSPPSPLASRGSLVGLHGYATTKKKEADEADPQTTTTTTTKRSSPTATKKKTNSSASFTQRSGAQAVDRVLGLDINTNCTGITILDGKDGKLLDIRCVDTKDHSTLFDKMNVLRQTLHEMVQEQGGTNNTAGETKAKKAGLQWAVAVEDSLKVFAGSHWRTADIMKLSNFNAVVCYELHRMFGQEPMRIHPNTARVQFGIRKPALTKKREAENMEQQEGEGEGHKGAPSRTVNIKTLVWARVKDLIPEKYVQRTRTGSLAAANYDMADSLVIAHYALNHEAQQQPQPPQKTKASSDKKTTKEEAIKTGEKKKKTATPTKAKTTAPKPASAPKAKQRRQEDRHTKGKKSPTRKRSNRGVSRTGGNSEPEFRAKGPIFVDFIFYLSPNTPTTLRYTFSHSTCFRFICSAA